MSDDIVKALLDSLTPDQKQDLIKGILNSNVKGGETPEVEDSEETVSSNPHSTVNEDFSVTKWLNFKRMNGWTTERCGTRTLIMTNLKKPELQGEEVNPARSKLSVTFAANLLP